MKDIYMKKIKTLDLSNFRGYVADEKRKAFDLNADIILITGKNGVGKTSLLMALDRALNGLTSELREQSPLLSNGKTEGKLTFIWKGGETTILNHEEWEKPGENQVDPNLHSLASFFYQEAARLDINDAIGMLTPKDIGVDNVMKALEKKNSDKLLREARGKFILPPFDPNDKRRPAIATLAQTLAGLAERKDIPGLDALKQVNLNINQNDPALQESQVSNLLAIVNNLTGNSTALEEAPIAEMLEAIADGFDKLSQLEPSEKLDDSDIHRRAALKRLAILSDNTLLTIVSDPTKVRTAIKRGVIPLVTLPVERNMLVQTKTDMELTASVQLRETESLARALQELAGDKNENALIRLFDLAERNLSGWQKSIADDDDLAGIRLWLDNNAAAIPKMAGKLREWQAKSNDALSRAMQEAAQLNRRLSSISQSLDLSDVFLRIGGDTLQSFPRNQPIAVTALREKLYHLADDISAAHAETARQFTAATHQARHWAKTERDILDEESRRPRLGNEEAGLQLFDAAMRILKLEQGESGITRLLPNELREDMVRTLNRLLARFHFPSDFLPIRIKEERKPRAKESTWLLVAGKGDSPLKTANLSTGQRTQLAICWCITLNYALAGNMTHRVMGFDDFTTALDMGQLIPAAALLRQIAYCDDYSERRQIIITSHHEDLTNKLLDYLLPPPDRSLRVIEFTEWRRDKGPTFKTYEAHMPLKANEFNSDALHAWLKAQRHSDAR